MLPVIKEYKFSTNNIIPGMLVHYRRTNKDIAHNAIITRVYKDSIRIVRYDENIYNYVCHENITTDMVAKGEVTIFGNDISVGDATYKFNKELLHKHVLLRIFDYDTYVLSYVVGVKDTYLELVTFIENGDAISSLLYLNKVICENKPIELKVLDLSKDGGAKCYQ